MALTLYQQDTQRLLHDPNAQAYSLTDLTRYINQARSRIALKSQCVRLLLRGGTIVAINVTAGGSGYTSPPIVSIVGSGQLAFAAAHISGGAVTSVTIIDGGWGYVTPPTTVQFAGGGGSGAAATASVDFSACTTTGQEIVKFSQLNFLATQTPGVFEVISVLGIACQWGAGSVYKPTLGEMTWTEFQAFRRINANQFVNFPVNYAKYGQGDAGSFYLFPLPASVMSMDIDCCCLPTDLAQDSDPEAIPLPWTLQVPYYAAWMAFNQSSRKDDADRMLAYLNQFIREDRAGLETVFSEDPYYVYSDY